MHPHTTEMSGKKVSEKSTTAKGGGRTKKTIDKTGLPPATNPPHLSAPAQPAKDEEETSSDDSEGGVSVTQWTTAQRQGAVPKLLHVFQMGQK